MYHHGELGDRTNCIPLFLKAAAQGNAEAQAEVGKLPVYYPNIELLKPVDVVASLRRSAESGNLDAQYQMSKRYQTGDGVPNDAVEAFKWMQKAAQQDQTRSSRVSDAIYELALMYEQGQGVKQDLAEARDFIVQAAAGSQPDARFRLGQMCENGDGVPQDDYQATRNYFVAIGSLGGGKFKYQAKENLLKLYADGRGLTNTNREPEDYIDRELKDKHALIEHDQDLLVTPQVQFFVGKIYYQGKLVPQDFVEAAARLHLAANQGVDDARKMLDELEPKLSAAQKTAAESRLQNLERSFEMSKKLKQMMQ